MKDDENPEWVWSADITEVDGRYLLLYISKDMARVRFQDRLYFFLSFLLTWHLPVLDTRKTNFGSLILRRMRLDQIWNGTSWSIPLTLRMKC
jgi:hypothetical protein